MRPRRDAAEYTVCPNTCQPIKKASMRPRRDAAEYVNWYVFVVPSLKGFNEAAA